MNRKTSLIILGIAILLLVGGFLYWNTIQEKRGVENTSVSNQSNQEQIVQQNQSDEIASVKDLIDGEYHFDPVDTSDWKTYRNEELGFEVKIPKDWFCGGVALDPDSKTSLACLKETQKKNTTVGNTKEIILS